MFLFILTLSALCVYTAQQTPETFQFQESDAIVKRQITSYKSNVIHHDPKYKNGQAESIIQFEMFPQAKPEDSGKPGKLENYGNYNKKQTEQQNSPQQTLPKFEQQNLSKFDPQNVITFAYNYKGGNNRNVAYQSPDQKQVQPQSTPFPNRVPTASPYIPQSQEINVGYSVSFAGKPDTKHKFSKPSQDGAEIITGFRKETVRQPTQNFQNTHSATDLKKQKTAAIKPKPNIANTNNQNNEAKTFINNLSSQPFEYFSKVQKPNRTTHNRVKPPQDAENAESITSAAWMNLSPYVELYRSEEQNKQNLNAFKDQQKQANMNLMLNPQLMDFSNIYDAQKVQNDFNRNLFGRSEKGQTKAPMFDFTNAYNTQTEKIQSELNGNAFGRNEQPKNNFVPINYPSQDLSTQQIYQHFKQLGSIPVVEPGTQTQQTENFPQVSRPVIDVAKLMQQYPVDTTLLRDYPPSMSRPLDMSIMQAMQQQAANSHPQNSGNVNQFQNNFDYPGRQIQNLQMQPNNMNFQNPYQGTNQVSTYVPDWQQGTQGKSNFDSYFDYAYSSLLPQETQTKSIAQVNNDIYGNYGVRTKPIRSIQLHTNLQPPPENSRNRRHFNY